MLQLDRSLDMDEVLAYFHAQLPLLFERPAEDAPAPAAAVQGAATGGSRGPEPALSVSEWHQVVYDCCVRRPHPWTGELVGWLEEWLQSHCSHLLQELVASQVSVSLYAAGWRRFVRGMAGLDAACAYLNRLLRHGQVAGIRHASVRALALRTWKHGILLPLQRGHRNKLVHHVLRRIDSRRRGKDPLPMADIRASIDSLVIMGEGMLDPHEFFTNYMEAELLRSTQAFYAAEWECSASCMGMLELLRRANGLIRAETVSLQEYCVPAASVERVLHVVRDAFLLPSLGALDEALYLCITSPGEDWSLAREMYDLLAPSTTGIGQMARVLERALAALLVLEARAIPPPADPGDPRAFCFALCKLHDRYAELVRDTFGGESVMHSAFDRAFRALVNRPENRARMPEYVARYGDWVFRRSKAPAAQVALQHVATLFRMLEDKDAFLHYHSHLLAHRLLAPPHTASMASELAALEDRMVTTLQELCGSEYASKLSKMLLDVRGSETLNAEYLAQATRDHSPSAPPVHVLMLTSAAWPNMLESALPCPLPQEMAACMTGFVTFYTHKHSGRKLTWLPSAFRAEVAMHGWPERYELHVGPAQFALLQLFQDVDEVPIEGASQALGWARRDVLQLVATLADVGLLRVAGDQRTIHLQRALSRWGRLLRREKVALECAVPWKQGSFLMPALIHRELSGSKRTRLHPRPFPPIPPTSSSSAHPSFAGGAADLAEPGASPGMGTAHPGVRRPSSVDAGLDETRRICLQAAIVRVLKDRRRLTLAELVACLADPTGGGNGGRASSTALRAFPGGSWAVGEDLVRQTMVLLIDKGYAEPGAYESEYVYVP